MQNISFVGLKKSAEEYELLVSIYVHIPQTREFCDGLWNKQASFL